MYGEVVLKLSGFEQRLMVNGLVEFKNDLTKNDKPTEDVDDLILKVTMDKLRSRAGTGSCEAYVGDELACKCQVLFMLG